jgi:hypothetical protein
MYIGQGKPRSWLLLALIVLAIPSLGAISQAWAQTLPAARPIPFVVQDNRSECVLPTPHPDEKYLLILGSLSLGSGPYRVTARTEAVENPPTIPEEKTAVRVSRKVSGPNSDKGITSFESDYAPAEEPPRTRNFFLFVKERDFYSADSYVMVLGERQGVARHCQVYVDRDYHAGIQPTVDDVIHTFDDEVYPRACRTLGRAADVDRDGRFTILLTPWLGKLADGKVSLGGFVRGSDFFRDLAPPFGNRCDMMYLNTDLQPGPTLRTILAHEYTHAVIFSEHVFGSYQPQAPRQDEEGWLNEGLAHMVEDLSGYSWSNLDYRISAFLSAPGRYQLVVQDYFRAGLFRSHGNRGATYLFLRWCCDQFGEEVMKSLVRTNLTGIGNIEAATGQSFADLFRQWTIALALSGTNLLDFRSLENFGSLRRIGLHRPLAGRLLCGPRFQEMSLADDRNELDLTGTSAAYFLLHSPAKSACRLTITAGADTNLQVTLVRLPKRTARLTVHIEPQENQEAGSVTPTIRLAVTAHDQDVTLEHAAWERLVPTANRPEDTSYRPADPKASSTKESVKSWFGDLQLKAGETRTSEPITLPSGVTNSEDWIFKISAVDTAGHHISAWALR